MDLSKYNFECQKAFHNALQLSKSYGHQSLEVEHVAFALLRDHRDLVSQSLVDQFLTALQVHLKRQSRIFGSEKIGFGRRLDAALDDVEGKFLNATIDESALWQALIRQSTSMKSVIQKNIELAENEAKETFDESANENVIEKKKTQVPNSGNQKRGENLNPQKSVALKIEDVLTKYTIDLNAKAERGEIDPIIGRDSEVRRILEILGRKKKNNPILIGEPGVGKSAVVEALALRITSGQIPETMKGKRIFSLDLGSLLAGAKFRGEFEDRLKNLMKALESHKGQIILFIDEIHMIVGAGNSEGNADAANLIKPSLARGELHCIGATTLDEYRKYIEKDAALERRFQPVLIEEPSRESTIAILRGIKANYELHHGVQVDDDALICAVDLSIRYLPSRTLPDKAIDLMDEACSRLKIEIASMPVALDNIRGIIESLEIEQKAISPGAKGSASRVSINAKLKLAQAEYDEMNALWRQHQDLLDKNTACESKRQELLKLFDVSKSSANYDFAAKIQYSEIPKIESELKSIRSDLKILQQKHHYLRQVVGRREVAEVISVWTGIPIQKMLDSENQKLILMEERISGRVFGQFEAVQTVCRAVRRSRAGVSDPARPVGVFLFMGPTGVGKTETAKALAEELFNDESKLIRVDMSEYMQEHNVARLVGSPPGYVGHGEGGELTEAVRRKPYSVVLFDEIEKAHPRVLDILLQTFDDGRLTDGSGKLVDFTNTILILTSNILLDIPLVLDKRSRDESIRLALTETLRPEFVNRIDEIVEFQKLNQVHYSRLVDLQLERLNARLSDREIRIFLSNSIKKLLIDSARDGRFGGRALKRAFQIHVTDVVSEKIIQESDRFIGAWLISCDELGNVYCVPGTSELPLLPAAQGS